MPSEPSSVKVTTGLIMDAARITQKIYEDSVIRHAVHGYKNICLTECRRAEIMAALASDDSLCDMLAGRISQLGHGVTS